jgi:Na+/melibiose symporter-like transporter
MNVLGPDSPLFRREPNGFTRWVFHHPMLFPLTYLVIGPLQELAIIHRDSHSPISPNAWHFMVALINVIFIGMALFQFFSAIKHMRGFCDLCAQRPLGGPQVAQEKTRYLRCHHRVQVSKKLIFRLAMLIMIIGVFISIVFNGWVYLGYMAIYFFASALIDRANQIHAWLIPWCPQCKDDGRWQEPSPVPDPTMTKQHS